MSLKEQAQPNVTFVKYLYWYSLLITAGTPIGRILYKQWYTWTIQGFWPTYPAIEDHPEGDRAFGLHAVFSLLWITCAYIQVVQLGGASKYHRAFGYVTLTSFLLHAMGCLNILFVDVENHGLPSLNSFILFGSIFNTSKMILRAVWKAKNGDMVGHSDDMAIGFCMSLAGAGTIRTIAVVQTLLQVGPVFCEMEHLHVGGIPSCEWTYTWRLLWIHTLTLAQLAWYVQARNSGSLNKYFFHEIRSFARLLAVTVGCFLLGIEQKETFTINLLMWGWNTFMVTDTNSAKIQIYRNPADVVSCNKEPVTKLQRLPSHLDPFRMFSIIQAKNID